MDCFYTDISGKPERCYPEKEALKDAAILPHICTMEILSVLHASTNYQYLTHKSKQLSQPTQL